MSDYLKIRIEIRSCFPSIGTDDFHQTSYGKIVLGETLRFLCENFLYINPSSFNGRNPSSLFLYHRESNILLPEALHTELFRSFPGDAPVSVLNLADNTNLTDTHYLSELWRKDDSKLLFNERWAPTVSATEFGGRSGRLFVVPVCKGFFRASKRYWILSNNAFFDQLPRGELRLA